MSAFLSTVKRWFSGSGHDNSNRDDAQSAMTDSSHIVPRDHHTVSRKEISENALKVLYRLSKAGYEAFLVGGGVRDILLGLHPKDFDIATNATPEQVRKLFRNSRIIGRRFKLVHILFGRDMIEVATFRAHCDQKIEQASEGMILRDNVYGDIEEDAERRDFTINALYYNIKDFSVHDYCGGLTDLRKRQLRMIGDAEKRYREDPVRMLRAIRLSTKLELSIEPETKAPISDLAPLLEQVPAARLWEEYRKMFLSGKGQATFQSLQQHDLLSKLFPATDHLMHVHADFEAFIHSALENTDRRIADDKTVNPAFLIAVFLWQPLLEEAHKMETRGMNFNDAFFKSMGKVLAKQSQHISIPRRYGMVIRDIWALQVRLPQRHGKKVWSVLEHPRFRAGYDFLMLRAEADPSLRETADWWTKFQDADKSTQHSMLPKSKRRKPKRRKKNKNQH
ncbi:polynucleotide adenylyltransferase PcnB [Kangiella sediminilitoris]|uniref:Poly(A) polymerase I n=1 Tax=Kangiella sediminilitoris TaxID=1144748 RepID=A0A1B3BD63_9GAMM|nr:polynucleotide adenylyltransferase PcnB [Kangiella sediminilitoris]AOE50759.1 Poly(A) polymerase I [Kangiella sediminilitoris]